MEDGIGGPQGESLFVSLLCILIALQYGQRSPLQRRTSCQEWQGECHHQYLRQQGRGGPQHFKLHDLAT